MQAFYYGENLRPEIRQLFERSPERLLDIGCGTGSVGVGLKQEYPGLWVWGCELNSASAKTASTRLDKLTTKPTQSWAGPELKLLATVDTVLLLDVLEHMYNPWEQLQFLAAHIRQDAQVIVSLPNVGHFSILRQLSEGTFPYQPLGILDITHVRFFTLAEMNKMFSETGFRIEQQVALSRSDGPAIESFPSQIQFGKLSLRVDSADEYEQLSAIQFGFRLRKKEA